MSNIHNDPILIKKNRNSVTWYLFGESGYSGPYVDREILQMIERGKVEEHCKAWSNELEKWIVLSEFPQFQNAFKLRKDSQLEGSGFDVEANEPSPEQEDEFWEKIRKQNLFRSQEFSYLNQPSFNKEKNIPVLEKVEQPVVKRQKVSAAFAVGIIVSMAIVMFLNTRGYFREKIDLSGVSKQEGLELKAALMEDARTGIPTAAIAISNIENHAPSFVVASSQKDVATYLMRIEGIPGTLIGAYRFLTEASITLRDGIGRSPLLLRDNGRPVPVGEYRVSIVCGDCGMGKNVLAQKTYFVGGVRDNKYDIRLREYHEAIRQIARSELQEAKQLTDTLEKELNEVERVFETIIAQGKYETWNQDFPKWQAMHLQIGQVVKKWDDRNSIGEIFYAEIFSQLKKSYDAISNTLDLQNRYIVAAIAKMPNLADQQASLISESSIAQSGILSIRQKIKMVEHLPLTANGMPRTE